MDEQKDSRTDNNTPDLDLSPGDQAALRALRVLEAWAEARRRVVELGGAKRLRTWP